MREHISDLVFLTLIEEKRQSLTVAILLLLGWCLVLMYLGKHFQNEKLVS